MRLLVRQSEQALTTGSLFGIAHHIRNMQGGSAWTLGIGEDVQLGNIQVAQELVGLLETLGCLATTAHHDIDTDKGIGHDLLDTMYLVGKELTVVVAVHQLQHGIAATLQRNVVVRHEGSALGAVVDEFVANQIGFQRTDAIAADALDSIECLDEVDKVLACSLSEVTDVDTRQHNLLTTFACSLLSLCHQRGDGRIATEATGIGNGAVGTEVVTAVLYLQEVAGAIASRAGRCKGLDVLGLDGFVCRDVIATYEPIRQELDEVGLLVRAQHQVDTLNLANALWLQLGIAASDNDKGARILTNHAMNSLTTLVVGHISD